MKFLLFFTLMIAANAYAGSNAIDKRVSKRKPIVTNGVSPVTIQIVGIEIFNDHAVVSWKTDRPATGQILYGESEDYGDATTDEPFLKREHKQTINEYLKPGTTYNYKIISNNSLDIGAQSTNMTFTTPQ